MAQRAAPAKRGFSTGAHSRRNEQDEDAGVEANARLTGATAAILLVLLAVEGVTILRIFPLLSVHVFVGMLLIPPVVLKMATTMYRFAKYYRGAPAYQRKGPPAPLLRFLGPFVIVLTVAVLGSGVGLLVIGGPTWLLLHKATFVLWFCVMAVHVLAHLLDTARLAPRDYYASTRREVAGAGLRQWTLAAALAVGFLLGALFIGRTATYKSSHFTHSGLGTTVTEVAQRPPAH